MDTRMRKRTRTKIDREGTGTLFCSSSSCWRKNQIDRQRRACYKFSNMFSKKSILGTSVLLFKDDASDESDLLCIYKSHNSLLWLLVFMMFLTGKTYVYRTGTINISTWIPFCKTNARRNLDLERQKSLFLQILGRFVALLPKRNGSIGLWRFTFAT